jgi:hypothetical protein
MNISFQQSNVKICKVPLLSSFSSCGFNSRKSLCVCQEFHNETFPSASHSPDGKEIWAYFTGGLWYQFCDMNTGTWRSCYESSRPSQHGYNTFTCLSPTGRAATRGEWSFNEQYEFTNFSVIKWLLTQHINFCNPHHRDCFFGRRGIWKVGGISSFQQLRDTFEGKIKMMNCPSVKCDVP